MPHIGPFVTKIPVTDALSIFGGNEELAPTACPSYLRAKGWWAGA